MVIVYNIQCHRHKICIIDFYIDGFKIICLFVCDQQITR